LEDAINAVSDKPKMSVARHYRTGEVLEGAFLDRKWSAEDLRFTNQIHRADLYEILYSAVKALDPTTLRLGYEFVGVDQDADGVTVAFANGERYRGAALIGCDGIRSTVRSLVFGPGDPLFTGRAVYRFLVPMDKARPFMGDGMSGSYVAPGRSLLRYSIRRETLVNCVAFIKDDGWTGEGWSQQVPAEELESLFPGWHPDVLGLARNAPREGTAKWAL
jgi:salicylate hydroxylase